MGDAAGAELGDLEGNVTLADGSSGGDSGSGEDGEELHLDG